MQPEELRIDEDLRVAAPPPAELYGPEWFDVLAARALSPGWHVAALASDFPARETAVPHTLLRGVLDRPLVITRDRKDRLHCLSNVCTHRGAPVARAPGPAKLLQCAAHGRQFRLDGEMMGAPAFETVPGFPSPADSLARHAVETWGPLLFVATEPSIPFAQFAAPLRDNVGDPGLRPPAADATREVAAHWLLWLESRIAAFPASGVDALSFAASPAGVRRLDAADDGAPTFDVPVTAPDGTRPRVGGMTILLFPATVLEIRPGRLSVDVVQPVDPWTTRIRTITFAPDAGGAAPQASDASLRADAIAALLQHGAASPGRPRGRYAPVAEAGVHMLHRLVAAALARR